MNFLILILGTLLTYSSYAKSFQEEGVRLITHDGFEIKGVLTYPKSENKKLPGVILIHGSGALDRNLWLPGNISADGKPTKMFENIAKTINQAGAVVLRYDKRGVTHNPKGAPSIDNHIFSTADVQNLLADVQSAIATLRSNPQVDPNKIFLLGLSEGTLLAPLTAIEDKNIAGLILLSAMGRNLKETLYFQFVERQLDTVRSLVDTNQDELITEDEIAAHPHISLPIDLIDLNGDGKMSMLEIDVKLVDQYYQNIKSIKDGPQGDWLRQHEALPPNYEIVSHYSGSILLLQGEADLQTPLEEALLIQSKMQSQNRTNFKLVTFKGLGHGFSPNIGPQKSVPTIGPIANEALIEIGGWIRAEAF